VRAQVPETRGAVSEVVATGREVERYVSGSVVCALIRWYNGWTCVGTVGCRGAVVVERRRRRTVVGKCAGRRQAKSALVQVDVHASAWWAGKAEAVKMCSRAYGWQGGRWVGIGQ